MMATIVFNCKVRGQYKETKQEAIAAWNKRAKGMRKIVEYEIITEVNIKNFTESVNAMIKEGWDVYGYPYALKLDTMPDSHAQAMVKYEEEKEQEPKIDRLQEFLNKDILDILDDLLSNRSSKTWKTTVKNRIKYNNISNLKDLKDGCGLKYIFSDSAARDIFGEIIDELLKFSKQDDKK